MDTFKISIYRPALLHMSAIIVIRFFPQIVQHYSKSENKTKCKLGRMQRIQSDRDGPRDADPRVRRLGPSLEDAHP